MSKARRQSSRTVGQGSFLAGGILAIAFIVAIVSLTYVPEEPSERIASVKAPRLVADCISEAYGDTTRRLAPGVFEYSVRNGKGSLQMQFLVTRAPGGSLVQVRRGALYALSNRWRDCL